MQVTSTALGGLQRAEAKLEATARKIAASSSSLRESFEAGSPVDVVDLSETMVALLEAKQAYLANLQVLETASELEEALLR